MNILGIILFAYYASLACANTESFIIHIPSEFPLASNEVPEVTHPTISLKGINHQTKTFSVPVDSTYYIELKDVSVGENYQIKICWTALNPVFIDEMGYKIVPHMTKFQDTVDEHNARIFIYFDVIGESYPPLKAVDIPINVSVVNMKLGIPVDLYGTLVYISLVVIGIYFASRRYRVYEKLKNN